MKNLFLVLLAGFTLMGEVKSEPIADEHVWSISGRGGSGSNECHIDRWSDGRALNSEVCMTSANHARIMVKHHPTTGRGLISVFIRPYAQDSDPLFLRMVVPAELKISRMFPLNIREIQADEAFFGDGLVAEVLQGIPGGVLESIMGNYSIMPGLLAMYDTAGDPSKLELLNIHSSETNTNPILGKQLYPYQALEMNFQMKANSQFFRYTYMSTQSYEKTVEIINQYGFSVYYAGAIDELVLENVRTVPVEEPTLGLIPYYEVDGWRIHAKRLEEDGGGSTLELLAAADPRNTTGDIALLLSGGDVCLYLEWLNPSEPYSPWAAFEGKMVNSTETEFELFYPNLSPSELSPDEYFTCSGYSYGNTETVNNGLAWFGHAGATVGLRTVGGVFLTKATFEVLAEDIATQLFSGNVNLP